MCRAAHSAHESWSAWPWRSASSFRDCVTATNGRRCPLRPCSRIGATSTSTFPPPFSSKSMHMPKTPPSAWEAQRWASPVLDRNPARGELTRRRLQRPGREVRQNRGVDPAHPAGLVRRHLGRQRLLLRDPHAVVAQAGVPPADAGQAALAACRRTSCIATRPAAPATTVRQWARRRWLLCDTATRFNGIRAGRCLRAIGDGTHAPM